MKKTLLIAALSGIIAVSSCKKDSSSPTTDSTATGMNAVNVPSGFLWATSRTFSVSVSITDTRFGTAAHLISIYDGDPYNGGKLLANGTATTIAPFTTNITTATTTTTLYVVKRSADNSTITQKVTVTGAALSLTFSATDPTVTADKTSGLKTLGVTSPTSPDCNSGCTLTISANAQNVSVNSGDVVCITGSNITVGFANVNGGTVRVCGVNVTLSNYNFSNSSTILVTNGASVNLSNLNFNGGPGSTLSNWGTVSYSGSFPDNGIINNYGTMTVSGDFNENSNAGVFTNNGTLTIGGSFNYGTTATATNNNLMTVGGNFQQNQSSGLFVNQCSLTVGGNYNQSGPVKNYSFIKVGGETTINSSTTLNLYNTSEFETNNFILDGSTIAGNGATSLLKITGSVTIQNSGANVTGPISVCSTNAFNATYYKNGAAADCSLYIPKSSCNGEGNGTATVTDTDGDGVPDNLDAYPTDPTKAYNSSGGIGTVAFEDQWPNKGDFDMNDLVMAYNYKIVTNASNTVVQVCAKFNLLATGGTLGNGFAVQFPIAPSAVSGITSTLPGSAAALEAGQTNAVVVLFTNMRAEMATWNTQPGVAQSAAVADSISFNVASGPSLSTFGQNGYNPFIFTINPVDGLRHETHLPGQVPSTLAATKLFGTGADNTNVAAGRYYVTTTGLPYAITVPTTTFSYPIEGTDITLAYLNLAAWAQSGGSSYADWYSNTATGYRNTALIYTK